MAIKGTPTKHASEDRLDLPSGKVDELGVSVGLFPQPFEVGCL